MSYFARKLRYGAHDSDEGASYMALVEISKKKGGKPVEFVLYRRIMQYAYLGIRCAENRVDMICFKAVSTDEAIKLFWPWDEGTGKRFPGHNSKRWQKTTLWLDHVAAGGGHECYGYGTDKEGIHPGNWARVGRPAYWSKRRRKKPLQFGNLAHVLLARQKKVEMLDKEKSDLERKLFELQEYDYESDSCFFPTEGDPNYREYVSISQELEFLGEEIRIAEALIEAAKAELRYKVRQMFPQPVGKIPKRDLRQWTLVRNWY